MKILKGSKERQMESIEKKLADTDNLLKRVDGQLQTFQHFRQLLVQERNDLLVSMRKLEAD